MSQQNHPTTRLKQLVEEYEQKLEIIEYLCKISEEVAQSGDPPQQQAIEEVQKMWTWQALPAVLIHIVYTSYTMFEYLEQQQSESQQKILQAVIYLSVQMAELPSIATEMIAMRYPLYFYPILKSGYASEQVKSLIFCLFITLLKQNDGLFFVKNELTSMLIYELIQIKSSTIYASLLLLQSLVDKQPNYFKIEDRKLALTNSLNKFIELSQPFNQRQDIQININTASTILEKVAQL